MQDPHQEAAAPVRIIPETREAFRRYIDDQGNLEEERIPLLSNNKENVPQNPSHASDTKDIPDAQH